MNIDPSTIPETIFLGKLLEVFVYVILGFFGTYYTVLIQYFLGITLTSTIFHVLFPIRGK